MKIPFLALIMQGIPEMIAIVTLAFAIAKAPLDWKKICLIGIGLGFISYLLRLLPITFGIHTVILISILFVLMIKMAHVNFNTALIGSLLGFLAIIVVETLCLSVLMPLFSITPELFFGNTLIRILITLPQVIVLFVISYILNAVRNKKIIHK